MAFWNKISRAGAAPEAPGKKGAPPRRVERHPAKRGMKTSLGRALDLSSGGARVRCDLKPDLRVQAATPMEIFLITGSEVVNARVCWIKKRGLLKGHWEMGLKFIAVSAAQQRRLSGIAEKGFLPAESEAPAGAKAKAAPAKAGPDPVMLALEEHFVELELKPDASADDVRAAHRRLVRFCHPDVAEGTDAKEKFLRLQASYQILIDAFREREGRLATAA